MAILQRCQKFVVLLPPPPRGSSSHFLFPRDSSGTIADTNIINTPPKPFRPTDVPFVGYKTETKDLGEFLAAKSIFTIVAPSSE